MTTKDKVQLSMQMQMDNTIAALAAMWKPVWWIKMLIEDAQDRKRHRWRWPRLPYTLNIYVPRGIAPKEIELYLNGIGIKIAFITLTWTIEYNEICMVMELLVPGRMKRYAEDAIQGYTRGKPFSRVIKRKR